MRSLCNFQATCETLRVEWWSSLLHNPLSHDTSKIGAAYSVHPDCTCCSHPCSHRSQSCTRGAGDYTTSYYDPWGIAEPLETDWRPPCLVPQLQIRSPGEVVDSALERVSGAGPSLCPMVHQHRPPGSPHPPPHLVGTAGPLLRPLATSRALRGPRLGHPTAHPATSAKWGPSAAPVASRPAVPVKAPGAPHAPTSRWCDTSKLPDH